MAQRDEFFTRDIWVASYLHALGHRLTGADAEDEQRGRVCFRFANPRDKAYHDAMDWRGETNALIIGPKLANSYRWLVGVARQARNGGYHGGIDSGDIAA